MKKICFIIFLSSFAFASNVIELTGEYTENLGNPFRVVFEKKEKDISIFSVIKDVKLEVDSNIDNDSIYNLNIHYPKEYILKNKSLESVSENFFNEEYNVIHSSGDFELDIKSGNIYITFFKDNIEQVNNIQAIDVKLDVEIKKNGKLISKTLELDNNLGIEGTNYSWSITSEDLKNLKLIYLDSVIKNIIEVALFRAIKDVK